ncbi:Ig-like domain repeat protein [Sanguibacter sp. HDW7]|uniref:Ig-like domain repeat protein n=1 Tax=Sanguibacter sp. HDW7 TaxID=2714931 RepID=UPI00140CD609|nr:Ig-like domain repeat protein [Sanguibacter sp. HDW7]QIK83834.1 hypothetical protein G7063_09510 [Sanguibacter sp. HDW7]
MCALALVLGGAPAATAAPIAGGETVGSKTASVPDAIVEGELIVTLGSGRDASGRPVETRSFGVRTASGAYVPLTEASVSRTRGAATAGDTVRVEIDAPRELATSALRAASSDRVAQLLSRSGAVDASAVTVLASTTPSATTKAAHVAHVVTVADRETTGNYSQARAKAVVENGGKYWVRESGGVVKSLAVASLRTMPWDNVCDFIAEAEDAGSGEAYEEIWAEAQNLVGKGAVASKARSHLVVMLPEGCASSEGGPLGWTGLAMVGKNFASGGAIFLIADDQHTAAHEMGHNFGLGHSNLDAGDDAFEYFGAHSVMGASVGDVDGKVYAPPALDPAFREYLGILPASAVTGGQYGKDTTIKAVTSGGVITEKWALTPQNDVFIEYRNGLGVDKNAFYAVSGPSYQFDLGPGVRMSTVVSDANGIPTLYTLGGETGNGGYWATVRQGEDVTFNGGRKLTVSRTTATAARFRITGFARGKTTTKLAIAKMTYGTRAAVRATVSGSYNRHGTVSFYVGTRRVATVRVGAGGIARALLPANVRPGQQTIKAVYSGDATLGGSSVARKVTVSKTKVGLKVDKASTVKAGRTATFTVRVTGRSTASPLGTVYAKVGSKTVSAKAKVVRKGSAWVAVVKTSKLPRGKVYLVHVPARASSPYYLSTTIFSGRTAR